MPNIINHVADNRIGPANRGAVMTRRFAGWCIYFVILCGAFALPLREFGTYARHSDVHSYVLLIPFVTAYLIYIRWKQLSRELRSSWGYALLSAAAGTGALFASLHFTELGQNDYMTLVALSFVCFVIAGIFLFLGSKWALSAMFPLFFLAFMIPLPEAAVDFLENASKEASAEVANWLFVISGTPALRTGNGFSASWNFYHGGQRMQWDQVKSGLSDHQPPGSEYVFAHHLATGSVGRSRDSIGSPA